MLPSTTYTSPASRIPFYFLLAFCSHLSHKHKRIPLFPQETFLSADTKTCQQTSRFILPHYETVSCEHSFLLTATSVTFFLTLPPPPPPPEIYEIGPQWERGLSTCSCRSCGRMWAHSVPASHPETRFHTSPSDGALHDEPRAGVYPVKEGAKPLKCFLERTSSI